MLNVIYTEIIKLKSSKLLWFIPVFILVPAIMYYSVLSNDQRHNPSHFLNWNILMHNNYQVVLFGFSPLMFSLFIGFLIAREFQEKTINSLFSYPISPVQLLLAKYFVLIPIIFLVLILEYAAMLGIGFSLKHEPMSFEMFWMYNRACLWLSLMTFAFIPFYASVCMVWKSFIPAIAVGLLVLISSEIFENTSYSNIYPWTATMHLLKGIIDMEQIKYLPSIISLFVIFIVPFTFSLFYYSRMDIDNV
jgi:hypothetical protein